MPGLEAVPGRTNWVLGVLCQCPMSGGILLARHLFTQRLQVISLPRVNTEQNLCCWGATPLRTICLDVFVRRETRLNGAGVVLRATLCAAFEQHPMNYPSTGSRAL